MAVEAIAGYIRDNVALDMLGPKTGRKFSGFMAFLFFGVLSMNIAGIIPGINIAASSVVAVPMVFALITYVTFIGAGIGKQGVGGFFASQLFPPGLPVPMYLLITPIEFLSNFIVRPVTLTLRLLCNMISGPPAARHDLLRDGDSAPRALRPVCRVRADRCRHVRR